MNVSKDKVVTANYVLKNIDGELLDESTPENPMAYLHGSGDVAEGLENALEGKVIGDNINVTLKPDEAYGDYDEALVQEVSKEMFSDIDELEEGLIFQAETPDGEIREYEIVSIEGDKVTIDSNHPLAGETLVFDIDITDIREATAEEIEHGHIHHGDDHCQDEDEEA